MNQGAVQHSELEAPSLGRICAVVGRNEFVGNPRAGLGLLG